jgi:Kinesin motor domain
MSLRNSPRSSTLNLQRSNPSSSQTSPSMTRAATAKSENVLVSVRVRPLSDVELKRSEQHIWDVLPGPLGSVKLSDEWKERLRKTGAGEYVYDNVFAGSENQGIYSATVADLVRTAMEGYSGTVFAYGQTASGKTYSKT